MGIGSTIGKFLGGGGSAPQIDLDRLQRGRAIAQTDLNKQKAILDESIAQAKEEELQLKQQLTQRRKSLDEAIQRRLGQTLAGIGAQSDIQRAGVGQQAAQRGLLRSSIAQEGLENVDLAQLEQEADARAQTGQQLDVSRQLEEGTFEKIAQRRKQLERERQGAELREAEQRFNLFDEGLLNTQIKNELAQAQFDEQNQAMFGQLLTMTGMAAGAAFGGPLGAVAGGTAGGTLGRTL